MLNWLQYFTDNSRLWLKSSKCKFELNILLFSWWSSLIQIFTYFQAYLGSGQFQSFWTKYKWNAYFPLALFEDWVPDYWASFLQHFKIEFFQIATWMKHEIATSMIPWPGKSIICNLRAADQSLTSANAHYWEKVCLLAKIIQKMVIANSWCRLWNWC